MVGRFWKEVLIEGSRKMSELSVFEVTKLYSQELIKQFIRVAQHSCI